MTNTVLFVNEKGGVGKSTATWNIAGALADEKRVLLVDADKQRSLSLYPFSPSEPDYKLGYVVDVTLSDFIENETLDLSSVATSTGFQNMDIICADKRIDEHEAQDVADALCRIINQAHNTYDYVFIDFRRDFGSILTHMVQAQHSGNICAVVPVRSEDSFAEGLETVVRDLGGACDFRVLFTQVYRPNDKSLAVLDDVALEILKTDFPGVKRFNTLIRSTPKVGEATYHGRPVTKRYPTKKVSHDYQAVARELVEMCEGA